MRQSLIVIALALAVAGCKKGNNPTQPTTGTGTTVSISGDAYAGGALFSPTTLTTTVGSTVVWTNRDSDIHTTTSNSGVWNSNNISPNGTFSHQFAAAGTFQYRCTNHPTMTGTVVVQ